MKDKTIAAIPDHKNFNRHIAEIVKPMAGDKKRDWFSEHAYHCLPLLIGNQYGFSIRSLYDFKFTWNGGNNPEDVSIIMDNKYSRTRLNERPQIVTSHFGMGVVTIQNRFNFKTPKGVNLMTVNPPNHFIDGVGHMTGVVESDNLRRDFTFNLKCTRPGHTVTIKKGDLIGCIMPVPRGFIDSFNVSSGLEVLPAKEVEEESRQKREFARKRQEEDPLKPSRNGHLYAKGVDAFGNQFDDHQTHVKRHPKIT